MTKLPKSVQQRIEKEADTAFLKEHDWLHACLTGDCPHDYERECLLAAFKDGATAWAERCQRLVEALKYIGTDSIDWLEAAHEARNALAAYHSEVIK